MDEKKAIGDDIDSVELAIRHYMEHCQIQHNLENLENVRDAWIRIKKRLQQPRKLSDGVKPVDLTKAYPSTIRFYRMGSPHGHDEITAENYAQFFMKVMCIEGGRYRRGYIQRTPKKDCIYTVNLKEWDSNTENISVVEIPDAQFPKSRFKPAFYDENGWEVA